MTKQVTQFSHAANRTSSNIKSKKLTSLFPTSRNTGKPVHHCIRNKTQFKPLSAVFGFQRVHFAAFALLVVALAGVFFWLPTQVKAPDPESLVEIDKTHSKVETPPDSPWSDAQLAKQRREAQEVLSKILEIQAKLEAKKVNLWAADAFAAAMATAATGDDEYRARNFNQAQQNYRDGLQQFETLQDSVEGIFQQQLTQGQQAIEQNQPSIALESMQLALYLKPQSPEAQSGLKRAEALDQVMQRIAEGQHLMKAGKYHEAKQQFSQALALDSQSKPAQQQLAKAKLAIKDQDFANAMSQGYAEINQQNYEPAIAAFGRALNIRPNAEDAKQALLQAQNADIQTKISNHLSAAQTLESQEKWQAAKGRYQQLLTLDSSVIKARIGAIRSDARAKLDEQLQDAIDQPQRLASASVFNQSQRLYQEALKIAQPGPRLTTQIQQLDSLLQAVQQPVALKIQSNNQTKITLYKVGVLGNFNAKNLDLKPGKYTLIGTRDGYRDVRHELTLLPNSPATTIVVQCEEKITNG